MVENSRRIVQAKEVLTRQSSGHSALRFEYNANKGVEFSNFAFKSLLISEIMIVADY